MAWINNLKINSKLMIMILIPMLGLLYFSIIEVIAKVNTVHDTNQADGMTKLAVNMNNVVHELQKEEA